MQVHRSKGVTTLKLTKRERDTLKAAHEIAEFIADIPGLGDVNKQANNAADVLEDLMIGLPEKETVEA